LIESIVPCDEIAHIASPALKAVRQGAPSGVSCAIGTPTCSSGELDAFLAGTRVMARLIHDVSGLSQFALELSLRELSSARGSLMLLDPERRLRIQVARGLPDWVIESTATRLGEGVAGQVAACGRPLLVESLRSAPPQLVGKGSYCCDTYLSVPVPADQRVLGVVNVTEPVGEGPFGVQHLQQLVSIADSLGLAIHRALRFREAEELAVRDDLTGLYNRRYLAQFMDTILERAQRENFPVTLLVFDIDHFKHYNDRYGHPAGDAVLREVAKLMVANFRTQDAICRLGGEEFAVVLWDGRGRTADGRPATEAAAALERAAHPVQAFQFAERLRRATMAHRFDAINYQGVTLSGGLATFPSDGMTRNELIERADDALYRAKRDGRNRVYLCGRLQAC
jgi:diguanylate cyclase (GGDEF)-like protein